ncbi:MAG: dTMP kinase [Caldilineae bacterium]|nr:MAG: dTMP kinase [Caldilineae bacterium]
MNQFITFEGIEGSGKTTQLKMLLTWLRTRFDRVLHTREPGGTAIGDEIRAILLDPAHTEMAPEAEILLFSAARAQIVRQVIRPHLEQGWIVVCDRFYDSTLAYQGYGHGLPLDALRQITHFATGGLKPDLTIYLDIEPEFGLRRKAKTPEEWNRMEAKELAFHRRVRAGYLALVEEEPERWYVVDARQPVQVVQEAIRARVAALLRVAPS